MVNDRAFREATQRASHYIKVCNMDVERLFAQIRASAPRKENTIERVCSAGLLAQWKAAHMRGGGKEPNTMTRQDLLEADVPICTTKAPPQPGKVRANILYVNDMKAKLRAERGALSRVEMFAKQKEFGRKWRTLSPDEQQPFRDRARIASSNQPEVCTRPVDESRCWGLASSDMPLSEEAALRVVTGEDASAESHKVGFRKATQLFNKAMLDICFLPDQGGMRLGQNQGRHRVKLKGARRGSAGLREV